MANTNFNPRLIHALTQKSLDDIPVSPSLSDLPGAYVQAVSKNIQDASRAYPKNDTMLICGNCGKKAKYDIGHVSINMSAYKKDRAKKLENHIQTTGYYRCKNCNSAGNWKTTNEYEMVLMSALLSFNTPFTNNLFSFAENRLFDGSSHKYSTDAEDHLLNKINHHKDAFIWNRLGNLYYKGGEGRFGRCSF